MASGRGNRRWRLRRRLVGGVLRAQGILGLAVRAGYKSLVGVAFAVYVGAKAIEEG